MIKHLYLGNLLTHHIHSVRMKPAMVFLFVYSDCLKLEVELLRGRFYAWDEKREHHCSTRFAAMSQDELHVCVARITVA